MNGFLPGRAFFVSDPFLQKVFQIFELAFPVIFEIVDPCPYFVKSSLV
jgi:hypothetical protein